MNGYFLRLVLCLGSLALALHPLKAKAQIVPDNTLPTNTVVLRNGCTACEITGGTARGNNLFHSFSTFSVSGEAYFNNPSSIENIFGRITGDTLSEIDGVLRANGNANLFLLNPNGIFFGPNASLDIGGSFIATTAERFAFEDGSVFSTNALQNDGLLSISTPVGLQFGQAPGRITNSSFANLVLDEDSIPTTGGLEVLPLQTLALVGSGVDIPGGIMFSPGGNLDIGSVGSNETVRLQAATDGWNLDYSKVDVYNDIDISGFAYLDTSSDGAGSINIQGRNITLSEGSLIRALTLGRESGKGVSLSATDTLSLSGDFTALEVWSDGQGASGNIFLTAEDLIINEGAYVDARGSVGQASNIDIEANSVELSGIDSDGLSGGLFAEAYDMYPSDLVGGNVVIDTRYLVIRDGAQISLGTFGNADAGDLLISGAESIEIGPASPDRPEVGTGIFNQADSFGGIATGAAGNLGISTRQLSIQGGGQVNTSTFSAGDAGNINIVSNDITLRGGTSNGVFASSIEASVGSNQATGSGGTLTVSTERLTILNGAQIATTARGEGAGGLLRVNATESILLSGLFQEGNLDNNSSGIFVSAEPGATSDVGELNITTNTLTVEDGAKISTDNLGSGRGNSATINAQRFFILSGGRVGAGSLLRPNVDASQLGPGGSLTLNISDTLEVAGARTIANNTPGLASDRTTTTINSELFSRAEGAGPAGNVTINETHNGSLTITVRDRGEISASTVSSTGGNIVINNPDALLLNSGGRLTAEAGAAANAGDGGNITLNLPDGFIVAVPNSNSDIVANAFSGTGGNINITAQSVLGIAEGRALPGNPTNDIDASSQFGNSGSVTLNNLETEIDQGLVELPTEPASPFQVAQRCLADSEDRSAFVVTGQGGAPPSPTDIVRNEAVDLFAQNATADNPVEPPLETTAETTISIVEAGGWQRDSNGEVTLIAQSAVPTASSNAQYTTCAHQERG